MSLIVNEGSAGGYSLLDEGTYPAICYMLVDLGEQYSETFGRSSKKVLIGWELPGEKLDNGEPRYMSNTYTASLNKKGNLRKELISWRGRDFTPEELNAFDLRNIVGAPCLLSVIHKIGSDGVKRAVIGGVMKLPKGMPPAVGSLEKVIFDLDDPLAKERIMQLPEWIQSRIKESETWKEMVDEAAYAKAEAKAVQDEPALSEGAAALVKEIEDDDSALPF